MNARGVLAVPDFRRIWTAQTISDFGDGLTNLALLIVVYSLTGSTTAIALMAIVIAVPPLTIGVVAGVYVDRFDRRRIMLASDLLRAVVVLGFILVHSADLLPLLYVLAFVEASVGTFFGPARMAFVPAVVPAEGLLAANGVSQVSRIVAATLGAGVAGILFGIADSAWPAFSIDALTFLVSFFLVLGIRTRQVPEPAPAGGREGVRTSLGIGLRTVTGSPLLVGVLVAIGGMMLGIGAVNVLFIPLLRTQLGVPITWLGAVDLAQTASMILSVGLVSVLAARLRPASIVSVSMVGLTILVALVAGVTAVWQVLLILFAAGWFITPLQAAVSTVIQTATDDARRGRVAAVLNAVISGASIASMAAAGILGDALGVRTVFLIAAGVIAVAAAASIVLFRDAGELVARGGDEAPAAAAASSVGPTARPAAPRSPTTEPSGAIGLPLD